MCIHSNLCHCDRPTFFINGSDRPIHGPAALAEELLALTDSQSLRVLVSEDNSFSQSNHISLGVRHQVAQFIRMGGGSPTHYPQLRLMEGDK